MQYRDGPCSQRPGHLLWCWGRRCFWGRLGLHCQTHPRSPRACAHGPLWLMAVAAAGAPRATSCAVSEHPCGSLTSSPCRQCGEGCPHTSSPSCLSATLPAGSLKALYHLAKLVTACVWGGSLPLAISASGLSGQRDEPLEGLPPGKAALSFPSLGHSGVPHGSLQPVPSCQLGQWIEGPLSCGPLQRYIHPEPQNVTLPGKEVFADVSKVRMSR